MLYSSATCFADSSKISIAATTCASGIGFHDLEWDFPMPPQPMIPIRYVCFAICLASFYVSKDSINFSAFGQQKVVCVGS